MYEANAAAVFHIRVCSMYAHRKQKRQLCVCVSARREPIPHTQSICMNVAAAIAR